MSWVGLVVNSLGFGVECMGVERRVVGGNNRFARGLRSSPRDSHSYVQFLRKSLHENAKIRVISDLHISTHIFLPTLSNHAASYLRPIEP
jgi:hypothetical protein